ncbi:DMT family transporter [Sporosarcina sp. FSL K6-3457]|uniref:DMT family transporter n=1 Tax=Sporosarcina sp. FSL K6-3457 TaxID=2978204 RepID=UPI0030F77CBA
MYGIFFILLIAIIFEVMGTTLLNPALHMGKGKRMVGIGIFFTFSFYLLATVMQTLPIGVVYATWSGVGMALIILVGLVLFKEKMSKKKGIGLVITIVGLVMINL